MPKVPMVHWARTPQLHSFPLGMPRETSPEGETNPTPNQGHYLAQNDPGEEVGVSCILCRHIKHMHTLQAAQPSTERGHHGSDCCQQTRQLTSELSRERSAAAPH